MSDDRRQQYRFKIDAFSVDSLPMARLAEYMAELATLLGEKERVHFSHLEKGSAVLVSSIEEPAAFKIGERLHLVQEGRAPREAMAAFKTLDTMLAKDNAIGSLSGEGTGEIIAFPGRIRPNPVRYGPFREQGTLDGTVIRVGGRGDMIPVWLHDGEAEYNCNASREVARRIASELFGSTVRVHGNGKWAREADGTWTLLEFRIDEFEVLDDAPLSEVVVKLRNVEGGSWRESPNAIEDLLNLRRDEGGPQ